MYRICENLPYWDIVHTALLLSIVHPILIFQVLLNSVKICVACLNSYKNDSLLGLRNSKILQKFLCLKVRFLQIQSHIMSIFLSVMHNG